MTRSLRWYRTLIGAGLLAGCIAAAAETWPPLRPSAPVTADWVVKQVLTRNPDVHSKHRAYLAALERVPATATSNDSTSGAALRTEIAQRDAQLIHNEATGHHLELQWRARQAFYDEVLALESIRILEEQRRLWDTYAAAIRSRTHQNIAQQRDPALDIARLNLTLIGLYRDRTSAMNRLNALLDRDHQAPPFQPAALGAPTPLPPDRAALLEQAFTRAPPMRAANIELQRANVRMGLARVGETGSLYAAKQDQRVAAATHELASKEERKRAQRWETAQQVMNQHEVARSKMDALKLYEQDILPRTAQLLQGALALYQSGRYDILQLLEVYHAQSHADLEVLQVRIDYEKALADLEQATGTLPPDFEKKMSLQLKSLKAGGAAP